MARSSNIKYNPIAWSMWANVLGVYGGCLLLLGGILAQFDDFEVEGIGIYAIVASLAVVFVEWPRSKRRKGYTMPREYQHLLTPLVAKLGFFATNYFARCIIWLLASIPCYFSLPTIVGGVTISIAAIVYFVAAMKGERWVPLPKEAPRQQRPKISEAPKKAPPRRPQMAQNKYVMGSEDDSQEPGLQASKIVQSATTTTTAVQRPSVATRPAVATRPTVAARPSVATRPSPAPRKSLGARPEAANKFKDYPWEHAVDDVSGETYYINTKTDETSWDKPDGWDDYVAYHNGNPPTSFA